MVNFPELFFYAEAEGLLPTRTGKLNAVIAEIKDYPEPQIPFSVFEEILAENGLKYEDLSEQELHYINVGIS